MDFRNVITMADLAVATREAASRYRMEPRHVSATSLMHEIANSNRIARDGCFKDHVEVLNHLHVHAPTVLADAERAGINTMPDFVMAAAVALTR